MENILDFRNIMNHTGTVFISQVIILVGFFLIIASNLLTNLSIIILSIMAIAIVYFINKDKFGLYTVPSDSDIKAEQEFHKEVREKTDKDNLEHSEDRNEILENIPGCVKLNVSGQYTETIENPTKKDRLYKLMKSGNIPDYSVIDTQAFNPNEHPNIQKFQTKRPKDDYFTTTNEKAYEMTCKRGFINFVDPCSKERTQALKFIYGDKSRRIIRF